VLGELIPTFRDRSQRLIHLARMLLEPIGVKIPSQALCSVIGGYFLWLTAPEWCDTEKLATLCKQQYNLVIGYDSMFRVRERNNSTSQYVIAARSRGIRLCWAYEEVKTLEEGMYRLRDALRRVKDHC
jgi:DNA-binding transcriptional MocR family regulator